MAPTILRSIVVLLVALISLFAMNTAKAAGSSWHDHAAPFDFLFGNHIDTHQQTRRAPRGTLFGFLYVKFSGQVTTDGLRIARHVDCSAETGCTVGWLLRGVRATGKFLYHVSNDHPVWQVERADIPQPGVYTHFHWLGENHPSANEMRDGFLLELQAIGHFCFVHSEDTVVRPEPGTCKDGGGVVVSPGLDAASHTNIVMSFPSGAGGGH